MKNIYMNKNKTRVAKAVGMALLVNSAYTNVLLSEESDSVEDEKVIIVEATRREANPIEVPVSITALTTEDLISSGITDINGIADLIPNLIAVDGGAPGAGNLTIRSLFAGGASTVGIYVDDVPYGPVIGGGGSSLALDAALLDIENIEVIRGPQGTLFGSSSMGGVVRYKTKDPIEQGDSITGYVSVDYSDTDKGGNNSILRGAVNLPLIEDELAISISAFNEDAEGYTDLPLLGEEDVNESDFEGGVLGVSYRPSDDLSIQLRYVEQEAEYGDAGYEGIDPTTGEPLLGDFTDVTGSPTARDLSFDLTSLTIKYDLDWATFKAITSEQELVVNNIVDLSITLGPIADAFAPAGAPHSVSFNSALLTERSTQELHLSSKDSDSFEWIVGLYYTEQDSDTTQETTVTPNDIELVNAFNPTNYEEFAAFANFTYYISEDLDVSAGVRYSDTSNKIDAVGTGVLVPPGSTPSGTEIEDSVTNYLFNIHYKHSDSLHIYGRAASGFRPGGANLVFEAGGQTIGEPSYQPDELWSYEFGFKGVTNNNLLWDVGYFLIDWKDAQLQAINPITGLNFFANAENDVQSTGIEASVSGNLTENFSLTANLGYTETELQGDEPNLQAIKGEGLPFPELTASLSAEYLFTYLNVPASIGGVWRHVGDSDTYYDGGTASDGTELIPQFTNYKNESYNHLDLNFISYFDSFTVTVYATNVTNEDAYTTVAQRAPTYVQGLLLRPRTYGLNVRYAF